MSVTIDADQLSYLMNLLGDSDGDLRFWLPCGETLGAGADVQDSSSRGLHATNPVARDNVSVIRGGLMSPRYNGADEYLQILDNDLLSAVTAGVDDSFSVGCAFKLDGATAAIKTLVGKWDLTTPNAEWRLSLTALEYPAFEVFDDSVGASNMGREDQTAVYDATWYVLIATYDATAHGAAPEDGMTLYLYTDGVGWGGAVDDADIDGGGVYANMENTATDVHVGCDFTGGAESLFFPGEIMMPFMTVRLLSAEEAEKVALKMVEIMEL